MRNEPIPTHSSCLFSNWIFRLDFIRWTARSRFQIAEKSGTRNGRDADDRTQKSRKMHEGSRECRCSPRLPSSDARRHVERSAQSPPGKGAEIVPVSGDLILRLTPSSILSILICAVVAQLDRVLGFEPSGRRFDSFRPQFYRNASGVSFLLRGYGPGARS
jgi:hypothetical protein